MALPQFLVGAYHHNPWRGTLAQHRAWIKRAAAAGCNCIRMGVTEWKGDAVPATDLRLQQIATTCERLGIWLIVDLDDWCNRETDQLPKPPWREWTARWLAALPAATYPRIIWSLNEWPAVKRVEKVLALCKSTNPDQHTMHNVCDVTVLAGVADLYSLHHNWTIATGGKPLLIDSDGWGSPDSVAAVRPVTRRLRKAGYRGCLWYAEHLIAPMWAGDTSWPADAVLAAIGAEARS